MSKKLTGKESGQKVKKKLIKKTNKCKREDKGRRQSDREVKIWNQVSEIFLNTPDDKLYTEILQLVLKVMKSRFGTFGYFDPYRDGAFVVPVWTKEIWWDKCDVTDKELIFHKGTWGGIWGRAIKEKKSLFSNKGPLNVPEGHIPIKNTLVIPIVYHDAVISAFHIANKKTNYDEKDVALLESIANHIAPILHARIERERQVKKRKQAEEELTKHRDHLEELVKERTSKLKVEVVEHKLAEEKLKNAFSEIEELKNQLQADNIYLQEEIKSEYDYDEIIGQSDAIKYVLYKAEQVGSGDTTVLILGETGTGKELVARAIHNLSPRKDRPLIKINCATIPANLIESELFGHEKGAFTGADYKQLGRFEIANGSTIFLDEIGELPLELQAKLLRVIQDGEFERLGNHHTYKTDVRIIAATNRKLEEEVQNKQFREDLYYRLKVFPISIPPLRQRKEDIPLLVKAFTNKFANKLRKSIKKIPQHALDTLQKHSWPGNIRELESVIERAVINTQGSVLQIMDMLEIYRDTDAMSPQRKSLEEVERDYILQVIEETNWKIEGKGGAAAVLGLNSSTLRGRMRKLGIHRS